MQDPAIKGTLFAAVVDDVNRLVEAGEIDPATALLRLAPDEIALLEQKINAAGWYDIGTYHRMVEILCEAEGGGHDGYWHERGRKAARRMAEAGIYQQLDYLGRTRARGETDRDARFRALGTDMRLLLSVHSAMLNFGEWKAVVDPDHGDRYRVEISGIAGIPDGIFMATAGMFDGLSELASSRDRRSWKFERIGPDLAVIRMTAPA